MAVHPRGCGDRVLAERKDNRGFRFIPAGAGIGPGTPARIVSLTVHPRGCGDRRYAGTNVAPNGGSSPRVRGSGVLKNESSCHERFIPAGAGIGIGSQTSGLSPTVHPRGCGDRERIRSNSVSDNGSSPRVRGSVHTVEHGLDSLWFIPAGAGIGCTNAWRAPAIPVHPRGCGDR